MFEKRDYPELEGKEIVFAERLGRRWAGCVVAISYHIGITIVDKENKNTFLICARGPMAPNRGHNYDKGQADIDEWDQIFGVVLAGVLRGVVDERNFIFAGVGGASPTAENCPFSQ